MGVSTSYGHRSPQPPASAGSGAASVVAEAPLTALAPNTTYHYRIVTENGYGTTDGEDRTFSDARLATHHGQAGQRPWPRSGYAAGGRSTRTSCRETIASSTGKTTRTAAKSRAGREHRRG